MVVSNSGTPERNQFFEALSAVKEVKSGGKYKNNVGGPVADKLDFIRSFRFNIAFENAQHPGYTSEKIVEAMYAKTIPLYWGDPEIGHEFNTQSFLNRSEYTSTSEFIEAILTLENDKYAYLDKLAQPWFYQDQPNQYFDLQRLRRFFQQIVAQKDHYTPIAQQRFKQKVLYPLSLKIKRLFY